MRAVISVSLPNEMAERFNELVDASGRAKSEIVKEALRRSRAILLTLPRPL